MRAGVLPIPDGREGRGSQPLLSSTNCQRKRQWAQIKTPEIPSQGKKPLSCRQGCDTVDQVAQRGCGVSILGDTQNQLDYVLSNQLKLTLLEQLACTKGSQEVPSDPNDSEIL